MKRMIIKWACFRRQVLRTAEFLVVVLLLLYAAGCKNDGVVVLESLAITPKDPSIFEGEFQQFVATGNYSDSTSADLSSTASWQSSDGGVATIDASGLATSQGSGTTVITASFDGVQDSTSLDVASYNPENGTWSATTSFSTARYQHAAVAYNDYLYVIDGQSLGIPITSNEVQYAPINPDGTVGGWSDTNELAATRAGHSSFAHNGRLYIVAGYDGISSIKTVLSSTANANGTLGTWSDAGGDLNTGRFYHASALYNGRIYVTGGTSTGLDYLSSVEYAAIAGNGTVGSWDNTSPSLATARYWHASVAYRDYLYVIGGYASGPTVLGDVVRIAINSDGSLGASWEEAKTTPANTLPRYGHTAVVYGVHLYVIGGFDAAGVRQNTVSYAPIDLNGKIGSWTTATKTFSTPRGYHTSAVYNGRLYVLGGQSSAPAALADVQYSSFNP